MTTAAPPGAHEQHRPLIEATPALRVRNLSKRFGSVDALADVSLDIAAGEVHGLLGENGSGKSTLIKVLAGYHEPSSDASVEVWGTRLRLPVRNADSHGIAVIHQDLGLVESMTVAENLGVSVGYGTRAFAPVQWRRERALAGQALVTLGVHLDPDARVATLTSAERTLVAVARARRQIERRGGQQVLFILDEPTAALPYRQAELVLELMRSLAAAGDAVLFVSHRLPEILAATDRVTVLRDGKAVATVVSGDADRAGLVHLMLGRQMTDFYPPAPPLPARPPARFKVDGLSGRIVRGASFELGAGEVVGFTGLPGEGFEELPALLAGLVPRHGTVFLEGGEPLAPGVKAALAAGVALVPADRRGQGLWPDATAWENITLPSLPRPTVTGPFLRRAREVSTSARLMAQFSVRPADPCLPASAFSGGNQQKIVLAKWLHLQPSVLLLDEPTQGVDAGARKQILELICEAASGGTAAALFSTDLEQLAAVCHRVLVMRGGEITAQLAGDELTEEALTEACQSGITAHAPISSHTEKGS